MKARLLPRPRLQFGMLSLFALMTLAAVWTNTRIKWLQQRQQVVMSNRAIIESAGIEGLRDAPSITEKPVRAPGWLWVFGDEGFQELELVVIVDHYDKNRPIHDYPVVKQAQRLFPEAEIGGMMLSKSDLEQLQTAVRSDRKVDPTTLQSSEFVAPDGQ